MIQRFCDWLAATWLSQLFANASWFVPAVQTIHILAIAAVVTMLAMLNLRLLRITRSGPALQNLAGGYIPWVWRALVILLITGILLTITEPARELMNGAFRVKMLLVLVLVVLTCVFHSALRKDPQYWSASLRRQVVVGSVGMMDLRLLGIGSRDRAITELNRAMLPWAWIAFVFAAGFWRRGTCWCTTWSPSATSRNGTATERLCLHGWPARSRSARRRRV